MSGFGSVFKWGSLKHKFGVGDHGGGGSLEKQLAKARLAALQEDLAAAQYEHGEFQANRAFRDAQQKMKEQTDNAQLRRDNSATTVNEIQQQVLQQNLETAKKTAPAQVTEADAKATQAKTDAFASQIGVAGKLGAGYPDNKDPYAIDPITNQTPGIFDVISSLESAGVDPKAMPALVQHFDGMRQQAIAMRDQLRQQTAAGIQKDHAEALGQGVLNIGKHLDLIRTAVDNGASLDTVLNTAYPAGQLNNDIIRTLAAGSTAPKVSVGEAAMQSAKGKALEQLYKERALANESLQTFSPDSMWSSVNTKNKKQLETTLSAKDEEIAKLESELAGPTKQLAKGKSSDTPSSVVGTAGSPKQENAPVVPKADYDKIPSGWHYRVKDGGPVYRKP